MPQCAKAQTLFVGVDPHKQSHTYVAVSSFGERLSELTFPNTGNGFYQALSEIKDLALSHQLNPVIGIEDSGGYGKALANFLCSAEYEVKIVNPVLVSRGRQKNTHPEKSDSQDAEEVARALLTRSGTLPNYIISENGDFANDLNLLIKDREHLVKEQTSVKNRLHMALYGCWGPRYKTVYQKDVFGKRALEFWSTFPTAVDFKRARRTNYTKPDWIKNISYEALPTVSAIQRLHIQRLVKRLQGVQKEITQLKQLIKDLVQENIAWLTTLRGCGEVTAAKVYAEVNDINRFQNHSKLARYAGIAPVKQQSGSNKKDIQSKRGNVRLRNAIKTVALSQIGKYGDPRAKAYYRKKLKEGKTKKQSLRCLMRQLTKIIFKMMKEERPYY